MSFRDINVRGDQFVDGINERLRVADDARLNFVDRNSAEALGFRTGTTATGAVIVTPGQAYDFAPVSGGFWELVTLTVPPYDLDTTPFGPDLIPPVRGIVPDVRIYKIEYRILYNVGNGLGGPNPPTVETSVRLNSGNTAIGDGTIGGGNNYFGSVADDGDSNVIFGFTQPFVVPGAAATPYVFSLAIGQFLDVANPKLGVNSANFQIYDMGREAL